MRHRTQDGRGGRWGCAQDRSGGGAVGCDGGDGVGGALDEGRGGALQKVKKIGDKAV